jgi:hypothetical protein
LYQGTTFSRTERLTRIRALKPLHKSLGFTNLVPQGRLSFRAVQIGLEDASVQQPLFPCNRPLLFCHPEQSEGSAVRHSCAPLLPVHNLHPSPTNPHGNTNLPLSFRVSRSGPRNCRSLALLGMTKKERAVARKEWLLNRGIFQTYLDCSEAQPSLRDLVWKLSSHADSLGG